jgi:hypothetical protein
MPPVLQNSVPFRAWDDPVLTRLPGTLPLQGRWIIRDEAFADQMAARDQILDDRRDEVIAQGAGAAPAAQELLGLVLGLLAADDGYRIDERVTRPDGIVVAIDRADPLGTLARLIQEDLCILEKQGDEHVLTAAALLFPASWTLAEKLGRPLMGIHKPVDSYDPQLALRVQRMFDWVRPEAPLWRSNWLRYVSPNLPHPLSETQTRPRPPTDQGYLRTEKQMIFRLPQTGAVVFAIHTYLLAMETLSEDDRASIRSAEERRRSFP